MKRFCPDMQDRIVDYMLGALDGSEAQVVEGHLARCEGCREHLEDLRRQSDGLVSLGRQATAGMDARRDRVIQAMETVAPSAGIVPVVGRFIRIAAAAMLILGAGVLIGRMTAPEPVNVERLRADLEASIVASLKPAVQESILAGLDERLTAALASNDAKLRAEVAERISEDLQSFTSNSERLMDKRFAELIDAIEVARQTDRRQVARALEQIKAQTGAGLRSVVALTADASTPVEN